MSTSAPPSTALESALRKLLGDALGPGDDEHAVDGLTPHFVATPSSVEQLAAVVAAANEAGAGVIPWGGGQHMALGNIPTRYDVALRTTKLDQVLEYEPTDLVVTVEAGITLGRLQALLAEHGQFLPIDAPAAATIGGVLAAGISGPSRHAYGLPRDWLLGCRVVLADGTIVKGGGRVVKNVAGYDLPKLAVGSLGTLGVIVEATFKVSPLPAVQETLVVSCPSLQAAVDAVFAADDRGLALRAVAVVDDQLVATLPGVLEGILAAYWLAGPRTAVERTAREMAELAGSAETRRLEGEELERFWAGLSAASAGPTDGVALSASLPPSAIGDFVELLASLRQAESAPASSLAYPTTGIVLARLDAVPDEQPIKTIEQARHAAVEAGGSLIVTAAPVAIKQHLDVWGDTGTALPLSRRLKDQFDPRGTLNPGRFVGGL